MKFITHILIAIVICLTAMLTSCETTIDINDPDEKPALVVHAIAQPDSTFTAIVATSYLFGQSSLDLDQVQNIGDDNSQDLSRSVIDNATVMLTNGSGEQMPMAYNQQSMSYTSNYTPMAGETLHLNVSTLDGRKAESIVEVPKQVSMSVVEAKKQYSKTPIEYYNGKPWYTQGWAEDSLLYITVHIEDPSGSRNYYRLKARSTYQGTPVNDTDIVHHDAFTSDSPVFYDSNINKAYYWWPAHFSNVFDDSSLNENNNTVTIAVRPRKVVNNQYDPMYGLKPIVVLELQQITQPLYYYLKAYQRYRIADNTTYEENIFFPSNINGGLGIMGGLNSCRIDIQ